MQKQMAHVGVPKREPCQKCGNPVFFAERLTISKSLYHRTCLRCARCDSQLTPGSFYETEVDGVFCCETCPDEEKKNNSNERLGGSNSLDDSDIDMFKPDQHRQSFSEKLAMFQTNGKGLLQKSLSDEEKSKSLKRLSELYAKHQTHTDEESKIIVSPSVVKPVLQPIANADNTSSNASSSESEDDDDDEDEKPPLPTNQPPSLSSDMNLATSIVTPTPAKPKPPPKANVLNKIYGNTEKFNSIIAKPIRSDLSSATQSETNAFTTHHNPSLAVNTESSQIDPHFEKPIANSINKDEIDFTTPTTINGINVFATLEPVISCSVVKRNSIEDEKTNLNVDNNMPSDALNSFTNVTKEVASAERMKNNNDVENDHHNMDNGYAKSNDASKFITSNDDERNKLNDTVEMRSHPYEQKEANEQSISRNCIENNSNDTIIDKQAPTNDDIRNKSTSSCSNSSNNMVRSRLSQFEALLFTEPKQTHSNNDSPKLSNRNTLAVVEFSSRPTDQSIKINTTDIVTRINTTTTIESDPIDNAIESNSLTLNTNVPAEEKEEEKEEFTSKINNRTTLVKLIENKEIDQTTPMHNEINGQISGSDQFMASLRKKPIPVKRVTKDVQEIADTFQLPPTPSKRKNRSNTFDVICRDEEQKKSIEITTNTYETEKLVTKNVIVAEITEPLDQIKEKTPKKNPQYPLDLNPFGSDDEDMDDQTSQDSIMLRNGNETAIKDTATNSKNNLNPFDSSDDEVELLKEETPKKTPIPQKPSTFRVSTNPFGSDSEDEAGENDSMPSKRMPIPTPRKPLNGSGHSTPEPSPRMSRTLHPRMRLSAKPIDDFYGSNASLASSNYRSYDGLTKNAIVHGSMSSLASTLRHKKGRAPAIPSSSTAISSVESSPFKMNSTNSSPSHSVRATPLSRKKRAAPPPPKSMLNNETTTSILYVTANSQMDDSFVSKASADESLTSSTLENSSVHLDTSIESSNASTMPSSTDFGIESTHYITTEVNDISSVDQNTAINGSTKIIEPVQRKLIPIDASLLSDFPAKNITEMPSEENVTYRRTIVPTDISDTPIKGENVQTNDRQWEKMKENKESQNKNRQSQILISPTIIAVDLDALYGPNKSSYGKWKRRKGPAPSLPVPPRKIIQMLPLQEIRHELEVIEVQQQGLEKQGVMLEKMIRERCEGKEHENTPIDEYKPNTKEVEDLILQLFELVNEKNELFRRQAELMYLRRQHRLEQEQADIEYEIRVLMAQPECNKTDSDKSREEALISRLVEVVQLRNEVIESLEMDRLREAEEDQSIKERLELHTAKRDEELSQQTPTKLSKKEKKKQKESKKLAKQKKVDADKDADESELSAEKTKEKKKKKKFLF